MKNNNRDLFNHLNKHKNEGRLILKPVKDKRPLTVSTSIFFKHAYYLLLKGFDKIKKGINNIKEYINQTTEQ